MKTQKNKLSFHSFKDLNLDEINTSHREVFEYLRSKSIMVNLHYIPIHTQPYYENLGFSVGQFPNSEQFYKEAISIPMHPSLSTEDLDFVIEELKEALNQ